MFSCFVAVVAVVIPACHIGVIPDVILVIALRVVIDLAFVFHAIVVTIVVAHLFSIVLVLDS